MNRLQKNIALSLIFAVVIASLFLTDSSLIQAVLVLIAFGTTIFLQMKTSSNSETSVAKILNELDELLDFKIKLL